jgi:hypothetical protein
VHGLARSIVGKDSGAVESEYLNGQVADDQQQFVSTTLIADCFDECRSPPLFRQALVALGLEFAIFKFQRFIGLNTVDFCLF